VNAIINSIASVEGHTLSTNDFLKDSSGQYSGQMTWWGAKAWVDHLQYTHPQLGVVYSQWRLPTVPLSSGNCTNYNGSPRSDVYGYNCVDSELGSLYYNGLGGTASTTTSGLASSNDPDLSKFINIHENFYHLDNTSSSCLNLPNSDCGLYFSFYSGFQWGTLKTNMNYAWAVLDGDVALFDFDGDTILDFTDNCPLIVNAAQINNDTDNLGDECDSDDDNDGLTDATELSIGTNPLRIDTDSDGYSDLDEVNAGSDPLDINSVPISADGDLNNDGTVNVLDVLLGRQILLGFTPLTPLHLAHGDVAPLIDNVPSPNGIFNIGDLVAIQRKALGIINF